MLTIECIQSYFPEYMLLDQILGDKPNVEPPVLAHDGELSTPSHSEVDTRLSPINEHSYRWSPTPGPPRAFINPEDISPEISESDDILKDPDVKSNHDLNEDEFDSPVP